MFGWSSAHYCMDGVFSIIMLIVSAIRSGDPALQPIDAAKSLKSSQFIINRSALLGRCVVFMIRASFPA